MLSNLFTRLSRVFVCGILVLATAEFAYANKSFSVRPAPAWVRTITRSEAPSNSPSRTSTRLLDDVQIKLGRNTVDRYYHLVSRIDNPSGLDDLSQLRFYFEPSYQQLTIHYVRILRGGTSIDVLKPAEIRMIQQEEELDEQIYNGTQAALIFMHDLRVGDVVDYSYSVSGENPILGGRYADTFSLGDGEYVHEFNLRLLCPSDRVLAIKNQNTDLKPQKQVIGSDTEYVWQQKYIAEVDVDGSLPFWFSPYAQITVSEFQNWSDVTKWALPYYSITTIKDAALRSKVEEWKATFQTTEDRALAALRFVQDEIRYLGIELGRYSHQPTSPEKVFARRFGDCKDKSLLLATIYAAMGIEATTALVNSYSEAAIESWQPSPFNFDHVIVKANINGATYWFDPTMSYQRGGLDRYYPPSFQRALVLRPGSGGLETIPTPSKSRGSLDVVEVYKRESGQAAITLNVTTTYRGYEADGMRYDLSTSSLAELQKSYLNFYAEYTGSIRAEGLPIVEDDERSNTIIVKEKYSIGDLWRDNKHRFVAEQIWTRLQKPGVSQRTMPLRVRFPLSIRQTIIVDLGPGYSLPVVADVIQDDALRFDYRYTQTGYQMKVEYSLETFSDFVPVEKVQQHLSVLDRAQEFVGFELPRSSTAVATVVNSRDSKLFGIAAGVVMVVIIAAVVLMGAFLFWLLRGELKWSTRKNFSQANNRQTGASVETPLTANNQADLNRALSAFACRCGSHPFTGTEPVERQRITYDGQNLVVLQVKCYKCRQANDLYLRFLTTEEVKGTRPQTADLAADQISE
jgi:hypothetical protein